jgi:histidinol-phosphatase (PHP family)
MLFASDYHVHTPLCRHAVGQPKEFVAAAKRAGLSELGFADHNPMPEQFDQWRMLIEELPVYLEFVAEARSLDFPVKLGLECDFIPGFQGWIEKLASETAWDYLFGSVHYIAPGWDVDNPRFLGRFTEGSVEEIWDLYWDRFVQCIRSRIFDVVSHPDLPKKFGHRPSGDLRRYYEPAVAALADANIAYEINTAGLRKDALEMYPAREFVELAAQAGVPVLINSDAHAPAEVGYEFPLARRLAMDAGYKTIARFSERRRFLEPLENGR